MKKHLLTAFQILVTLTVLTLIFHDPNQRAQMWEAVKQANLKWLFLGLLITGIAPLCATIRWGLLIRTQGIHLTWKRITELYFIGNFFNLVMPGSVGGDVVKVFYILKDAGKQKTGAFLSVAMDRCLGLISMISIATFFIVARYQWLMQTPVSAGITATVALILGTSTCVIVLVSIVSAFNLAQRLPHWLPGRAKIIELSSAFLLYGKNWKTTLWGIAISIPSHFALFTSFWCATQALGLGVSFIDICTLMPIVNTITSIPISVSGVGVREALGKRLLYALCGVAPADAVVATEMAFLCIVFYSLVGGVFYLFYKSSHGMVPSEDALEEMEHTAIEELTPASRVSLEP